MIKETLQSAVTKLQQSQAQLIEQLKIPCLIIIISAFASAFWKEIAVMMMLVDFIASVFIAVRIHRCLLASLMEETQQGAIEEHAAFRAYMLWYIIIILVGMLIITPSVLLVSASTSSLGLLAILLAAPFVMYVTSRLSLVLPDRSLGLKTDIKELWRWSDNNGWKLAGAIMVVPVLLSLLMVVILEALPDAAANALRGLASIPILLIGSALLAVCYEGLRGIHVPVK